VKEAINLPLEILHCLIVLSSHSVNKYFSLIAKPSTLVLLPTTNVLISYPPEILQYALYPTSKNISLSLTTA
jgi:hypothetical protein